MGAITPHHGSGHLADRPAADQVHPGYRWTAEDRGGEQYVSDGKVWVLDACNELWTLAYGEDVQVGSRIRRQARVDPPMQQSPFAAVFVSAGVEVTEFCEVMGAAGVLLHGVVHRGPSER